MDDGAILSCGKIPHCLLTVPGKACTEPIMEQTHDRRLKTSAEDRRELPNQERRRVDRDGRRREL